MKKVGLIINPVAGLGGKVGLKGSDGVAEEALRRGAKPQAEQRAALALGNLLEFRSSVTWMTCEGSMGGRLMEEMGFKIDQLWRPSTSNSLPSNHSASMNSASSNLTLNDTTSIDTKAAAKWMLAQGVDLLLFAGGDGTARDIFEAVGDRLIVLGVPAGVKVHSPVYAKTPARAGALAGLYINDQVRRVAEAEVVDLDEAAYRKDLVRTQLFGYLRVPVHPNLLQSRKAPTPLSEVQAQKSIAYGLVQDMKQDVYYILGPGTTTRTVMDELGLKGTLLGVDVVKNKVLEHVDVSENQLLNLLMDDQVKVELVLTPTGGQGYLLGRGNQQISSEVLKKIGKDHLRVLCTKEKLSELRGQPLMVDTGDGEVDALFKGYTKVLTGYNEFTMYKMDN